jgi:cytochrome c553
MPRSGSDSLAVARESSKVPRMKGSAFLLVTLFILIAAALLLARIFNWPDGRSAGENYELAAAMGRMQVYADKLYHAGAAENWELAAFYLHEIEEIGEEIEAARIEKHGVNVSSLASSQLLQPVERLEQAVQAGDPVAFNTGYNQLVGHCNACHGASGYGFVQIAIPQREHRWNQEFAPQPPPAP